MIELYGIEFYPLKQKSMYDPVNWYIAGIVINGYKWMVIHRKDSNLFFFIKEVGHDFTVTNQPAVTLKLSLSVTHQFFYNQDAPDFDLPSTAKALMRISLPG